MLEKELLLERDLFFFLNGSDSALLDNFFFIHTNQWVWIFFYLCFLFVFIHEKDRKEIFLVLIVIFLLVLFTDKISSGVFKPFFHRFRPTHHPDFFEHVKTVFNYRGGLYGFVSSHAANSFGFATFCALIIRNKFFSFTIFIFALLNSYSRIYLGVHFISDVVVGALIGVVLALLMYLFYKNIRSRWFLVEKDQLNKPIISVRETYFLCIIYYLYIVTMLIFNNQLVVIL